MNATKNVGIDFRVGGAKGDIKFAVTVPYMSFRGTKLVANDDQNGHGTKVLGIYIDGKLVTPKRSLSWWRRLWFKLRRISPNGIPTVAFSSGVFGNRMSLPTCPAEKPMSIEIEFLADSLWQGTIYGERTVLE